MIRTAIIDDDPEVVRQLKAAIALSDDIEVAWVARNARTGLDRIEAGEFDVLLCDLGLPDGDGINLIRKAASLYPDVDIIVVTMFADQRKVLDSIRAGARGYLLKDNRLPDCVASIHEIRAGGSPISPMIARQLLKRLLPDPPTTQNPSDERLSEREGHVLELLARGFSYAECANLLSVSPHTIGTFVKRIYRKLQVSSRAEAVFEASSRGILDAH